MRLNGQMRHDHQRYERLAPSVTRIMLDHAGDADGMTTQHLGDLCRALQAGQQY